MIERARECCEYCRVHRNDGTVSDHVEHIMAVSHGGQTTFNNLAHSCSRCNLYKGTNIAAADPETGDPTFLFHPRRHTWDDHFQLNEPIRVDQRRMLIELGTYPCQQGE